eukprot:TRINITY_DN8310_c0_g1_i1.p1 TRINITY_DN8310_c0_g1~~TRINITY_DN8310_c0_g1_i1.p1  ORF type:complete len:182 (+),score=18.14 TRINITY_DN8310_c0_g1_i1:49-594(+)
MHVECEHCLKTCDCPMCAPMEKAWVCYVDGDGNNALHAFTRQEIEEHEAHIFYPTEVYKNTQFDCWCDPVMDFPSGDAIYMCHYDYRRNNWMLTSVRKESRPGPLNDMQDYLDIGDGFPGHYNTNHILDTCNFWIYGVKLLSRDSMGRINSELCMTNDRFTVAMQYTNLNTINCFFNKKNP